MKNRCGGFATLLLTALTPVLLLVLATVAASCVFLLQWRRSHELCQASLLKAQTTAAEKINALFGLNPQASALRLELQEAEAALAASVAAGPYGVAAAQANLDAVVARQTALRMKQEWFRARAVLDTSWDLLDFENRLKAMNGVEKPFVGLAHLFVNERPAASLTPDHHPDRGFERLQKLTSTWVLRADLILPAWLRKLLPKLEPVRGSCSATLEKKGDQWTAILGEGKSSSNFSSASAF